MAGTPEGAAKARAKRAALRAKREAKRLGAPYVEPEEYGLLEQSREQPKQPATEPSNSDAMNGGSLMPLMHSDVHVDVQRNQAVIESVASAAKVDAVLLLAKTVRNPKAGLPLRLKAASDLLNFDPTKSAKSAGSQPPGAAMLGALAQALQLRNRSAEASDAEICGETVATVAPEPGKPRQD